MTKFAFLFPVVLLAACGEAPAPAPTPEPSPEPTASLPAPDQGLFAEVFASTCEGAEPVKNAVCKRAGLGSNDVRCEFGLGDDEYLRNEAVLTANETGDGWILADADTICTEHGATTAEN